MWCLYQCREDKSTRSRSSFSKWLLQRLRPVIEEYQEQYCAKAKTTWRCSPRSSFACDFGLSGIVYTVFIIFSIPTLFIRFSVFPFSWIAFQIHLHSVYTHFLRLRTWFKMHLLNPSLSSLLSLPIRPSGPFSRLFGDEIFWNYTHNPSPRMFYFRGSFTPSIWIV